MLRQSVLSAFVLLLLAGRGSAQVPLVPALKEGSQFETQEITILQQTLTIAGMETVTKNESITATVSTVGKRNVAGLLEVRQRTKSLQVSVSAQGMEYFFDSANPDKRGDSMLEVYRDIHKVMARLVAIVVYDKNHRVRQVKFDNNLLNGLSDPLRNQIKDQFDPQKLTATANQGLDRLPGKPVKPGDSWQREETVNLDAGQALVFQNQYTYAGTVEKNGVKLDKIVHKPLAVALTIADDSPLPLKLKESKLKPAKSSVLLFDRAGGRFVESKGSVRITGDITFIVNGNDLPAKLDLTITNETTEVH